MNRKTIGRRSFLRSGLTGLAASGLAAALPPSLSARQAGSSAAPAGKPVIKRTLGRTGIVLPVVSMGVMNADNPEVVRAALDSGIVMLDTANGYQRGRNERMIGEVVKGRPRSFYVIATKVPSPVDSRYGGSNVGAAESIVKSFLDTLDVSLKRLGLESVDILYVHDNTRRADVLFKPTMDAAVKAKAEGKARAIGVSTHEGQAEVIRAAVEAKVFDVVLAGYNFRQDYRDDIRAANAEAAKAGVGIVAMKTQAGGFWDRRRQQPIDMAAALKWVLNDPNVTTAIPGFTTFDQLRTDVAVMTDITLTADELKGLRLETAAAGGLYCQACGRCRPGCPAGLPIPDLMRGYMYAYGYRNLLQARDLVAALNLPENPCGDCAACGVSCAKGFDVRERVTGAARLAALPADLFA